MCRRLIHESCGRPTCMATIAASLVACALSSGCAPKYSTRIVLRGQDCYHRFVFNEVLTDRKGATFFFTADREPVAKGGVLYEPYPIAEDRSRLALLGSIDMDTNTLSFAIAGEGAYNGVFSCEPQQLNDAAWEFHDDGLRIRAVGTVPAGKALAKTRDRPQFAYNGTTLELKLDLMIRPDEFRMLLRSVRHRFADCGIPAVQELSAASEVWLTEQ